MARAYLRRVLDCWPQMDELLLICSELATNAVLHSQSAREGGQFTVRAEVRGGDYLWIEVPILVRMNSGDWLNPDNGKVLFGKCAPPRHRLGQARDPN